MGRVIHRGETLRRSRVLRASRKYRLRQPLLLAFGLTSLFAGLDYLTSRSATPGSRIDGRSPDPARSEIASPLAPTKLLERPGGPLADATRTVDLEPPFSPIDNITLATDGRTFRLAGLTRVDSSAICAGEDGGLWACGLQARVALHNFTRGEKVRCQPVGREPDDAVLVHCSVNGKDLAHLLVAAGWTRPADAANPNLGVHVAEARKEGRGLWRGGWQVNPPRAPNNEHNTRPPRPGSPP